MKTKVMATILILSLTAAFALVGCGGNLPFSSYDLKDYVKLGKYKGLEVNKAAVSVSNEEVQTKVKANVEATKSIEKVTTGKVAKGDNANIDYTGKLNGKAFEGGTAAEYDLKIGSGSFIPGFEDKLIGKVIGSTSDINVTFPKDYATAELAGKVVVFTVKINHVSKDIIPKYDEAWIAKNSKNKTKADYEKQVKADLIKEKEDQNKNTQISQLMQQVMESSKVKKYPEDELKASVDRAKKQFDDTAKQYGVKPQELWGQYGVQTQEEFDKIIDDGAKSEVKNIMVIMAIADKENLEASEKDIDKATKEIEDSKKQYMKQQKASEAEFEKLFESQYGYDIETFTELSATNQAVTDFILKNAKQVDKKN